MSKRKNRRKNVSINPKFTAICKLSQQNLKIYVQHELKKYYKNVIAQDGFVYVKGIDKVLLTAHMDTVHKEPVKDFFEIKKNGKHIITSQQGIGGDDRCGIYMILKILETTTLRPSILFCEDEEIGGIGSEKFCSTKFIKDLEKMYFLIELDRANANDVVYYSDANEDFHNFVEDTTGYTASYGSFSDISNLSPDCGVSSVNISCGYYNAHTLNEYVVLEEMENSIKRTIDLINEGLKNNVKYEYEYKSKYANILNYDSFYDNYYNTYYSNYSSYNKRYSSYDYYEEEEVQLWIEYLTDSDTEYAMYQGTDTYKLWLDFFVDHPTVSWDMILDYDVSPAYSSTASNLL